MSANKGLFLKYPNPIFIETGCMGGDGIQQALNEGFTSIYSIELLPEWYNHCVERYKDVSGVRMMPGDSAVVLEKLMKLIDQPVTFWLDAHIGTSSTPLLTELDTIKKHHIKTHTILIDDLRSWKKKYHGFDTTMLRAKLLEINPEYRIVFEDGYRPDDILVAVI